MKTISAQEFNKKYNSLATLTENKQEEPGYFERAKGIIQSRGEKLRPAIEQAGGDFKNVPELALNLAGQATGALNELAYQALPRFVRKPIESGVQAVASTKPAQAVLGKINQFATEHPRAARNIESAIEVGSFAAGEQGLEKGVQLAQKGAKVATQKIRSLSSSAKESLTETGQKLGTKAITTTENMSPKIMNRVARLTPSDAREFEKLAGKTHGQYLVDTGNFGSPEKIVTREAEKWIKSYKSADDALAKLPGRYQKGFVNDALAELIDKGERVSTPNVKASYLTRARQLLAKNVDEGLTMSEINEAKRMLEKNIKLGYNKALNPDIVEKATSLDSAIRNWQFKKAADLGFKNIEAINKQTQVSRFLANKLAKQLTGKTGLDAVSLTDWVVLSGMNPTAIGAYFTKKLFGAKGVQAWVAKKLSGKAGQPMVAPEEFMPAGYLPPPSQYNLPAPGIMEGQKKINSLFKTNLR